MTDSLSVSGKFSTVKSGDDIKVKVGSGSILLVGAADKNFYINGNILNDEPICSGTFIPIPYPTLPAVHESPLISGTKGNDTIKNFPSNVLISTGMEGDTISNTASNVTINGIEGSDSISTTGYLNFKTSRNLAIYLVYESRDIEIFGDAGDVYITPSGVKNVLIDAGNDSIRTSDFFVLDSGDYATAENFTFIGGIGNDYINSDGENNLFKFNIAGSTGRYSSTKSGDDIIVTVGESSVTLQGAANLSTVNIAGKKISATPLTLTKTLHP